MSDAASPENDRRPLAFLRGIDPAVATAFGCIILL
jgi:hypothetical protein